MGLPIVSVIIPTYNHADFLLETVRSVLKQSFTNFELIIVNDGSTDHTAEVIKQVSDSRIRYLEQENRGATAARNTGMSAASGKYIALLDADDRWHSDKLKVHYEFLEKHPEVGTSYGARFELNHSDGTIRELWKPPETVDLADLVCGFPFAPSDMVVRRDWAFKVGLFDESYVFYGDDLDFFCRLALAGCQFASVQKALTYRTRHAGRVIRELSTCVENAVRPLASVFTDVRCPDSVLHVKERAYANHYLSWALRALAQEEVDLGQSLLRKTVSLNPQILADNPSDLVYSLISFSIFDDSKSHIEMLQRLFCQLPVELRSLEVHLNWAIGRGYLEKGASAAIWGRVDEAHKFFDAAKRYDAKLDEDFLRKLAFQLHGFTAEFGMDDTQKVLQTLAPLLHKVGGRARANRFVGQYFLTRAFEEYRQGHHRAVAPNTLRAVFYHPGFLANRGMAAITLRSMLKPTGTD